MAASSKEIFFDPVGLVTINRNRRAVRFKITVKRDGTTRVTIPWSSTFLNGERFVDEHLQWIIRTKERMAKNLAPPDLILPGHLFSTRHYHYEVCTAEVKRLRIRYDRDANRVIFEVPAGQAIDSAEVQSGLKGLIENILRFEAKQYLPGRIAELAATHGYTFSKVTIKNNKTNWGSCSSRKNINLNLHLMRLNDRLIDYILVHELVHTLIPNHGPRFKATLRKHFPDTLELDRELKKKKTGIFSESKVQ